MDDDYEDIWGDAADVAVTDEDKEKKAFVSSKQHMIIVIDARTNMLVEGADGKSFLSWALFSAAALIRERCISDPTAKLAVLLMGTEKNNVYGDFKHLYMLQPLQEPSARQIMTFDKYANTLSALEGTVGKLAPEGSILPLDTALWAASHEFSAAGAKATDEKSILIFTTDDHPNTDIDAAATRANDSRANGESITVFPFQRPDRGEFDGSAFWATVCYRTDEELIGGDTASKDTRGNLSGIAPASSGKFEDLEGKIKLKTMKRRVYARIPFTLVEGVHIALGVYNTIYPAKKPNATHVLRSQASTSVKTESRYLDGLTGEVLDEHKMVKYYDFAGSRVMFSDAELKDLKTVTAKGRGLTLLGFKPVSVIRSIDNMRPPMFLYPIERDMEGSTLVFRALWRKMLDKQVAAICRFESRGTIAPRFVALLAEEGRADSEGLQVVPPGLFAVQLPYADDIRNTTVEVAAAKADASDTKAFMTVIQTLTLDFDACKPGISNPALQKFYAGLEALALNKKELSWDPEENDDTLPDIAGQQEAAEAELAVLEAALDLTSMPAPTKARATAGTKRKAAEAADDGGDGPAIDWAAEFAAGRIEKHTIPELKEYLKAHHLPVSGNKGELVGRVTSHLSGQPASASAAKKARK